MGANSFFGAANKNGGATALGIVTSRSGSGAAITDHRGHGIGKAVKQADISTITCVVTDTSTTPETQTVAPTVTISTSIFDTIQTGGLWWIDATTGYNFLHDLPATAFPNRGVTYRVVYTFTMTDATVGIGEFLLSI